MTQLLRKFYHTLRSEYVYYVNRSKDNYKIHWSYKDRNFGDILNPILFNFLTNKKAIPINSSYFMYNNYLLIGSILQFSNKYSTVWGSGFIAENSVCKEIPLKVYAVRGKLTRNKLLEQGIECPEVYGDPALLMPYLYSSKKEKKYILGIIPHYMDRDNDWLNEIPDNILIIDLITDSPLNIIDQINSCECIASSSLHGLIMADAYKIPSLWIEFSNKLIGGHFKFLDYFSSIESIENKPYLISKNTTIQSILQRVKYIKPKINISLLLDSCPFEVTIDIKNQIESKIIDSE